MSAPRQSRTQMGNAEKMREPPPNAISARLPALGRATQGDTFEINCSTRVEFDNYKASYLRM